MTRTLGRIGAVAASIGLVATAVVAGAASSEAGQLDGPGSDRPLVVTVVPVDPQPVVAGREGDVLLRVSVPMPAVKAEARKAPAKRAFGRKAARAAR